MSYENWKDEIGTFEVMDVQPVDMFPHTHHVENVVLLEKSDDIRIKYASKYAQSSNYWKNSIGMNQAVKELKADS